MGIQRGRNITEFQRDMPKSPDSSRIWKDPIRGFPRFLIRVDFENSDSGRILDAVMDTQPRKRVRRFVDLRCMQLNLGCAAISPEEEQRRGCDRGEVVEMLGSRGMTCCLVVVSSEISARF